MDVGMDVSNWGCHGASARGTAQDFHGFPSMAVVVGKGVAGRGS